MDVNSLRFTESVTITDSAGVVLATSVACSIKQHVNGMRDPIADIAVYFNTLSVIALGWNGVQGSLRVVWRGLPVYWVYAVQFYDSGTRFGLFCSPAGSPFLDPPTGSSVSGAVPQRRYTATVWQTGTADPVAIIHENSLGREVSWNRDSAGFYGASFSDPYLVATQESNRMVVLSAVSHAGKVVQHSWSYFGTVGSPLTAFLTVEIQDRLTNVYVDLDHFFTIQIIHFI